MSLPKIGIAVVLLAGALPGCGCDQEAIDRAVAFLDAHQSCRTDDDCAVVSDMCETIPGGSCGQLAMNRTGAESAEWRSIRDDLEGCAPDKCAVCLGLLVPTCSNGSCRGDD